MDKIVEDIHLKSYIGKENYCMNTKACTFISSDLEEFSFGYDWENPKCVSLKLQTAQFVNDMCKAGVKDFYSVCEQGTELWAAEIVTFVMKSDAEIKLHCIIPYEEQAAKWHSDTRELYYRVLEKATDVIYINTRYEKNCLAAARYRALEHSDCVFASVVNGSENEFVRYAEAMGKKVCVLGGGAICA